MRYDCVTQTIITGADGYAQPCRDGETGMLLAASQPGAPHRPGSLRNVFAPGDSWYPTGTLFQRDTDGDLWLVDRVADLIPTNDGPVTGHVISEVFTDLPNVRLAAAYPSDRGFAVAVTTTDHSDLDPKAIEVALAPFNTRPDAVKVLEEMPMTSWHRPDPARTPS